MYIWQRFFLIFCIFLYDQIANIRAQVNSNGTLTKADELVNKYVKHLVGFIIKEYFIDTTMVTERIVGGIIKGGFVLTNIAWNLNDKNKRFDHVGKIVKKRKIYGFGGQLVFSENVNDTGYSKAVSVYNWRKHISQREVEIPTIQYIANTPFGVQLTIIAPENNLLKNSDVKAITLASRRPKKNVECIIITYGKFGTKETYNASVLYVKTMSKAYCKKELCEYQDTICVTGIPLKYTQNIGENVNGGEPLICKGKLWGIIRGGNIKSPALPAASIYENRFWLRRQMRYYKKYINDKWVKSNGYQLFSSIFLLCTTIISIYLI